MLTSGQDGAALVNGGTDETELGGSERKLNGNKLGLSEGTEKGSGTLGFRITGQRA
jgi:hypothetical protein